MKAWVHDRRGSPRDVLQPRYGFPKPRATKKTPIVVRVHAVALNPDCYVLMRFLPNAVLRRNPRIPEVDFAGTVDESSNLSGTQYQPGDPVYGHILPSHHIVTGQGALCEFVAVSPRWIDKKPDKLSFVEAAALPTAGISAYKLLQRVPPYANVFVDGGSGGVGTILLQMLKQVKHARVVSTASQDSRHLVLNRLHGDEVVDYRTAGPLGIQLSKRYPRHFDVCIDLIGDMRLYTASPGFLKTSGTYIAFGGGLDSISFLHLLKWLVKTLLIGYWPACLGATNIAYLQSRPKSVAGGCPSKFRFVAVASEDDTFNGLSAVSSSVDHHLLGAVIDSVHSFDNVQQAYQRLLSRHAHGKVVVTLR